MKDNRKNRKLTYIRIKNSIRKGAIIRGHFLFSTAETAIEDKVDEQILEAVAENSKRWKTPLKLHGVNVGYTRDNPDMIAIKYTLIASQLNEAR